MDKNTTFIQRRKKETKLITKVKGYNEPEEFLDLVMEKYRYSF